MKLSTLVVAAALLLPASHTSAQGVTDAQIAAIVVTANRAARRQPVAALDGSISAGFSFTEANAQTQWTFDTTVSYRSRTGG